MTFKSIVHNPHRITEMFEEEVAEYTGAPHAVAVDSCTNALFLCLTFCGVWDDWGTYKRKICIPKRTYVSVPQTILNAGKEVVFRDEDWKGLYKLDPFPIWDCAKRFTSDMYRSGQYQCLSFQIKKNLPIGKGGMILMDDANFVEWAKKARYEGRSPVNYREDNIKGPGWNFYMPPEDAARGLALMQNYPVDMPDQIEDPPYVDLTTFDRFKDCKVI